MRRTGPLLCALRLETQCVFRAGITIATTSEEQRGEMESFTKPTTDDRENPNGTIPIEVILGWDEADNYGYRGQGNAHAA